MDTHLELEKKIAVLKAALEKAIGQLENIEVPTIPPVRMTPKELAVFVASDAQRRAQQTLAEIAEMLDKC